MKINSKKVIKACLIAIVATINILLWYYGKERDFQVSTIAFVLVWLNFCLSLFTYKRQPNISYVLLGASFVLEMLLAVNLFWVVGRTM